MGKSEEERINNILKRAFDKESGKLNEKDVRLTEDNPDGLAISIYKDEDQLKEIERRQKMEERKNKKKMKGRPKKSETVSNNSTKDKAHKDVSSSDEEEDSSDEEDAKLS